MTAIIFVFRSVGEIDHDGIDALREIFALYRKHVPNLLVFLTGLVHEETRGKLEKHGWFEEKVEKGRVLESWAAALDGESVVWTA